MGQGEGRARGRLPRAVEARGGWASETARSGPVRRRERKEREARVGAEWRRGRERRGVIQFFPGCLEMMPK